MSDYFEEVLTLARARQRRFGALASKCDSNTSLNPCLAEHLRTAQAAWTIVTQRCAGAGDLCFFFFFFFFF